MTISGILKKMIIDRCGSAALATGKIKMRIAFLGIPELGAHCLNALKENNKNIVVAVPAVPENPSHNFMMGLLKHHGIPALFFNKTPKEQHFVETFKQINPDVAVVCAFDHLIPKELLNVPKHGFINCHPSLLPQYRGGNPYFHVIANGEKKTGVTIHYMDEKFDTGNIIDQWETEIFPNETFGTLFNRLNFQTAQMIVKVVSKLEKEGSLQGKKQVEISNLKNAPAVHPERGDVIIDWNLDAAVIERFVRACNPIYGALTNFRGCSAKLWAGFYSYDFKNIQAHPGSIIDVSPEYIAIATGKGAFFPVLIELEGFMITTVQDFIFRTNPQRGEFFAGKSQV